MFPLTILEFNIFDTITGLPVHPLVVHAVVILLPVSALALIVIYLFPKWRNPFGWLTLGALAVGSVAAFVAKQSGEALALRVGLPDEHAQWGNILVPVGFVTLAVAAVWFWLQRKDAIAGTKSLAATIIGAVASVLAVAVLALTVLVGHSGASAVWAAQIAAQDKAKAGGSSTGAAKTYTMADVQAHGAATSCWTAIDGNVYDLTKWEASHPGGQQVIVGMCGTDGTTAFHTQHSTQTKPNQILGGFQIGTLSTKPASTASATPAVTTLTMAEVQQHASASSCWSAVDGNVYDLTKWIGTHPGGRARILAMCGKDGTATFHGEHHTSSKPNNTLAGFEIGKLG